MIISIRHKKAVPIADRKSVVLHQPNDLIFLVFIAIFRLLYHNKETGDIRYIPHWVFVLSLLLSGFDPLKATEKKDCIKIGVLEKHEQTEIRRENPYLKEMYRESL